MRRYMPRWRGENREHWTAYLRKRYAVLPRDKLRLSRLATVPIADSLGP
jgi:hypothetical protein